MKLTHLFGTLSMTWLFVGNAVASFHLMQIEQVIGGIDGDATAQFVQLRMESAGQNLIGAARLRAWDATGANPVLLVDFTALVPNAALGDRILIASPKFKELYPGIAADVTMENVIPSAYLAAGKLTYEQDDGLVLWSLAWGGAAFTGTNTGAATNDDDGNFGAPFAGPLPDSGKQALTFTGSATDKSTANVDQYALSSNPATVRNNAGASLTLAARPPLLIYQGTGALIAATSDAPITRPGKAYVIFDISTSTITLVQTFKGAGGKHQITLLDAQLQPITTNGDKSLTLFRATSTGTLGEAGYGVEFDDFSGPNATLPVNRVPPINFAGPANIKGTVDRRDSTASAELSLHSKVTVGFNARRTQTANDSAQTAANVLDALKQELANHGFNDTVVVD